MTKSSYRTADGVYVEFWHDYKTAANLKNIAIAPPQKRHDRCIDKLQNRRGKIEMTKSNKNAKTKKARTKADPKNNGK